MAEHLVFETNNMTGEPDYFEWRVLFKMDTIGYIIKHNTEESCFTNDMGSDDPMELTDSMLQELIEFIRELNKTERYWCPEMWKNLLSMLNKKPSETKGKLDTRPVEVG